jgi:hypothetical protein
LVVTAFAIAMAWVKAAVVFYLRRMVDRIEPYQANPLPMAGDIGGAELVRELATLVMLATVGWLAALPDRVRLDGRPGGGTGVAVPFAAVTIRFLQEGMESLEDVAPNRFSMASMSSCQQSGSALIIRRCFFGGIPHVPQ